MRSVKRKIVDKKSLFVAEKNGSHPHILITTTGGVSYLVDYRLKKPQQDTERATESVVDVTVYDEHKEFDAKVMERLLGMNEELQISQQGLNTLDQNFIHS